MIFLAHGKKGVSRIQRSIKDKQVTGGGEREELITSSFFTAGHTSA